MKKFIISILLFFSPFAIITLVYIAADPFMVIWNYDSYYDNHAKGVVCLNKDYVSTTTFDYNYRKRQYNSFIFGNSRSIFYQVSDWEKNLKTKCNCYHFDASSESLYALNKKVKYIDSKNLIIKNALLIIDHDLLMKDKPLTGHLFSISPHLENNENLFSFHLEFLKAFLSLKFLYAYVDFKLSDSVKPYMTKNNLIDDEPIEFDVTNNEIQLNKFENMIFNGKYYTNERKEYFYKRDTIETFSPVAIAEGQKIILKDILAVFIKHKTNFKIIISPIYDQVKFNKQDLEYLVNLFGSKNVFDFSGKNKFTDDYTNYYDASHYRPHVAREIMTKIYQNEQ